MVTKCSARDFVTKRGEVMPTVKLTKRRVDGLLPPAKGQAVLWDTEVRGFGARILPSGTKTFILQYRNPEGIQRRINIGRYGILRSEEHTSELQSLMRISYAVFCLKKNMTL